MPKLLSGKIQVTPSSQLSVSRYKYVQLAQAQPALGKPAIDNSVLISKLNGTTLWVAQNTLVCNTFPTKNVIYVSKSGSDNNAGTSISSPKASIRAALGIATSGMTIIIYSGDYIESTPLIIPDNVTISGQDSRVNVIPQILTVDVFKLKSGSTIQGVNVLNHQAPSFAFSIATNAIILALPIIKNCSSITGPFMANGTMFVPNTTIQNDISGSTTLPLPDSMVPDVTRRINKNGAGGGISIVGADCSALSLIKGAVVENFTARNQGGIGIYTDNATVQVTSSTTEFCSKSFYAYGGGILNLSSCTTKYGTYALYSEGYAPVPYIDNGVVGATLYSSVLAIAVTNPGSGYIDPPTITIAPPTDTIAGIQATATAVLSNGKVTSITITTQGSGYATIPAVTFDGISDTVATATAELSGISQIPIGNITVKPLTSTVVVFQYSSVKHYVSASTALVSSQSFIKISPSLYYIDQGISAAFFKASIIIANNHTFYYVGSGTTYNGLPENSGVSIASNQIKEVNYGKVYYSGVSETGLYKIGESFTVDQLTGATNVTSSTLNLAALSTIGPLIRNGVPSGIQLREISNDPNLIATTGVQDGFTAPTQYAVATYLTNNYLPLIGGTITGPLTVNDLLFTANSISSILLDENIILNPNGTGVINASDSRITNVLNPEFGQDVATKSYVDFAIADGGSTSAFFGDLYVHGNTIENTNTNGYINLATNGTGQVKIISDLDSTSVSTGALVIAGGVGIAKNLYVGTAVHAPIFYGNVDGTSKTVTEAIQSAITQLGTLTTLTVDRININGDTIKNFQTNTNIVLSVTGSGAIVPETTDISDIGTLAIKWGTGHFNYLSGTLQTGAQPNITSLANHVTIADNVYDGNPSLKIGYNDNDMFTLSTTRQGYASLSSVKFATNTSGTGSSPGIFEFLPNGQVALTIANGYVAMSNDLSVGGDILMNIPILTIGSRNKSVNTVTDFGIQYHKNEDISQQVINIQIISDGTNNISILNLTTTVGELGISIHDRIYLGGMVYNQLNNSWKILSANLLDTYVYIEITFTMAAGEYIQNPAFTLLNKNAFFGYNQTTKMFSFMKSSTNLGNVVTGDVGTINASLVSPSVIMDSGSIENAPIGLTTPAAGKFTSIVTDQYSARTFITVTNGDSTVIDSFDMTLIDTAKYMLKIKNVDTNILTGQEVLLVHDGSDMFMSEYGIISTGAPIGILSGSITGNTLSLIYNPYTADMIQISIIKFYA